MESTNSPGNSMESINSPGNITPHGPDESQSSSNIVIEGIADKTDLAASECFLMKSTSENGRNHANNGELDPLFLSQSRNGLHLESSNVEVAPPEFSKPEDKMDLEQKHDESHDIDEGENDDDISLGDLEDIEQAENEQAEEIEATSEVIGETLTAKEKEQTLKDSEIEGINQGKSEVLQGDQKINQEEYKVLQGKQEKYVAKSTQTETTAKVEKHTATMEIHTATMEKHTATIEIHTATIEIHTATIETHKAKLKDVCTFSTPEEAIRAIQTGRYQKITEAKDPNLDNRFRVDSENGKIRVPKGSSLLSIKSPIKGSEGKEYTIIEETDEECNEFLKNWHAYTTALQNTPKTKQDDPKETRPDVMVTSKQPKEANRTSNEEENKDAHITAEKQVENGIISNKLSNNIIAKDIEKKREWRAEDLTTEIKKKELGDKRLNFEFLKQIDSKVLEFFKIFNLSKIPIFKDYFTQSGGKKGLHKVCRIQIFGDYRRKFA